MSSQSTKRSAPKFAAGEQVFYRRKQSGELLACTIEGYDEKMGLYRTDIRKDVPEGLLEAKGEPPAKAVKGNSAEVHPRPGQPDEPAAAGASQSTDSQVMTMSDCGGFAEFVMGEFSKLRGEGQKASLPPWEALRNAFAPDVDKLNHLLSRARVLCPYLKETGVNYIGFQSEVPTRSKGHCHVIFFNAFTASSFPQGLYWPDLSLQLQEVLAKGTWREGIQVYPVSKSLVQGGVQPQGAGVMNYGADGPYVCGVNLFVASAILCIAAAAPIEVVHRRN